MGHSNLVVFLFVAVLVVCHAQEQGAPADARQTQNDQSDEQPNAAPASEQHQPEHHQGGLAPNDPQQEQPEPSHPSDAPPKQPATDYLEPTILITGEEYGHISYEDADVADDVHDDHNDDDDDDVEDEPVPDAAGTPVDPMPAPEQQHAEPAAQQERLSEGVAEQQEQEAATHEQQYQYTEQPSDIPESEGQQPTEEEPLQPTNLDDVRAQGGGIGFTPTVVAAIIQETSIEDVMGDVFEDDDEAQDEDNASSQKPQRTKSPQEIQADQITEQAEMMINKSRSLASGSSTSASVSQSAIKQAYKLLEEATALGSVRAGELTGFAYLWGDHLPWNPRRARTIFEDLSLKGSARAQTGLGFLHATGVAVNTSSQAKALVYLTFGALGGDPTAQMALGYRYWSGINLGQSCEAALTYYRRVAETVAADVSASGAGATSATAVARIRLADETEVAASSSSSASSSTSSSTLMDNDLLQYYKFLADKGDIQAQVGLGQLYLTGGRGLDRDLDQAFHYFSNAAEAGNSNAYAYLGKMYLDGTPSVKASNRTALEYFKRAADKGNPVGQSGLGIMYLYGRGVDQDYTKALKYFQLAADQGWVEGQLQLGTIYFSGLGVRRDYKLAIKYFQLASQSGHVLALYNLAQMHATGTGLMRSCSTATELYKNVAERGRAAELLMSAHTAYREGRAGQAGLMYAFLGELGYEVGQSNFAYLLDKGHLQTLFPDRAEVYERSIVHWERAADQGSGLARLKLGDYHYYGRGTPVDFAAAVHHYKLASDQQHNAQAMFNLAWMHEQGLGIKRDIHLAKRFYDLAAETSTDAQLPVTLALAKLAALFALHYVQKNDWWTLKDLDAYLGPDWDIYVISALCITLATLFYLRTVR